MNAGAPVFVPKATAVHSGNRLHRMTSSSGGREKKDGGSSGRSNNEGKALALQLFSFEGDEDRAGKNTEIDQSATGSLKMNNRHYTPKGPTMTREQFCMSNNRFCINTFLDPQHEALYNPDKALPWGTCIV